MAAFSSRTTMRLLSLIMAPMTLAGFGFAGEICDAGESSASQHSRMLQTALLQRGHQTQPKTSTILQSNSQVTRRESNDNIKERYLKLIEMAVTGSLTDEAGSCLETSPSCNVTKPFNASLREDGADWPPFGHTMVGHLRLRNVRTAIEETIANHIPGDFVELGVWRGGTCIYAKALYDVAGEVSRKVHLFDAFGEVPAFDANPVYKERSKFLAVSMEAVKHNFEKYGVLDDGVQFHKGLFKDTLPAFIASDPQQQVAVLRIDGNFYDSYQDALYSLYPMVPVGGIVIFDDVGEDGTPMRAWLDFKSDNGLPEKLSKIDHSGRWFRKEKDTKIDPQKRRPPRDANLITPKKA